MVYLKWIELVRDLKSKSTNGIKFAPFLPHLINLMTVSSKEDGEEGIENDVSFQAIETIRMFVTIGMLVLLSSQAESQRMKGTMLFPLSPRKKVCLLLFQCSIINPRSSPTRSSCTPLQCISTIQLSSIMGRLFLFNLPLKNLPVLLEGEVLFHMIRKMKSALGKSAFPNKNFESSFYYSLWAMDGLFQKRVDLQETFYRIYGAEILPDLLNLCTDFRTCQIIFYQLVTHWSDRTVFEELFKV